MSAQAPIAKLSGPVAAASDSPGVLRARAAHELFFAVVGPVGAGSSHVARQLTRCLKVATLGGAQFTCEMLKASDVIRASYGSQAEQDAALGPLSPLKKKVAMQEKGDELRISDHAAIAASLIGKIAEASDAMPLLNQMETPVDSGARCNGSMRSGFARPCQVL